MRLKNDTLGIINSINVLEKINVLAAKKNIEIIVLVSPDKYDLYYNDIKDKKVIPKPIFFSIYEQSKKKYTNIDCYKILSRKITVTKDVYYYDDTHWSPIGASIIADEIHKIIKCNKARTNNKTLF